MNKVNKNKLFDLHKDSYEALRDFPLEGYEHVQARLFERVAAQKAMTVLDLGVGMPQLSEYLIQLGCKLTVLAYSKELLHQIKMRLPYSFCVQADATRPLRLHGRFDLIVSAYALHSFDTKRKYYIIEQTSKFLKSGACMLIADIAFASKHDLALCYERNQHLWDKNAHYWIAEEISESLPHGLTMEYEQVSSCAGMFLFRKQSIQ